MRNLPCASNTKVEGRVPSQAASPTAFATGSGSGAGVVGTDHGWGTHQFVLGGAVAGKDFYGIKGPNGIPYPKLQLSGPNDTDNRGRWIPTTSVEQYAATLATWFSLAEQDLPFVFPLLKNFNRSNLGFI